MDQTIRLRLQGMASEEWADAFRGALESEGVAESVTIEIPRIAPGRLGALDSAVLSAIISGGAQILAGVIGALAAVYVARTVKTGENKPARSGEITVCLHGIKGSTELSISVSQEVSLTKLREATDRVGHIREICI